MTNVPQPISIALQTVAELFPGQATEQQMHAWFPTGIPSNPVWAAAPQTSAYAARQKAYVRANAVGGIFANPLPDTHKATNERERMWFIISHGDLAPFNPPQNMRSANPNIEQSAQPVGTPNPNHWVWSVGRGNQGPETNGRQWDSLLKQVLATANNDARGGMVKAAKAVAEEMNTSNNPHWLQHALVPGRMVSIMLYYLRSCHQDNTVSMVKFCLGDRLRPTFDVDALYHARATNQGIRVRDSAGNIIYNGVDANGYPVEDDLVPKLIDWIEVSCAHMITEVLNHYVRVKNKDSVNQLSENFKFISSSYPYRDLFEDNIGQFPYNR